MAQAKLALVKRNEGKVDREEDEAHSRAKLCAALLMQQQRLCEMETERSP